MADENYIVLFDFQGAGDATAGYKWSNTPGENVAENTGNPVEYCKAVQVHAKKGGSLTEQEAATAVRRAYGDGQISGPLRVVPLANWVAFTAA